MKFFILIGLLLLLGCVDAKKGQGTSYDSLSAAIIDGVITKDNPHRKAFILISNDRKNIYAVIKSSATFRETVRAFLKVYDSSELSTLVENSSFLDTTAKISASNVRFVTRIPPEGYDWSVLETERVLKGSLIVNFIITLTSTDGNKCVVYFNKIRVGSEIALLEKKNDNWYVTSVQRERPKVVE